MVRFYDLILQLLYNRYYISLMNTVVVHSNAYTSTYHLCGCPASIVREGEKFSNQNYHKKIRLPHIFILDARADSPQLLHVTSDPQQEAQVDTETPYVRTCLTAHPEHTYIITTPHSSQVDNKIAALNHSS